MTDPAQIAADFREALVFPVQRLRFISEVPGHGVPDAVVEEDPEGEHVKGWGGGYTEAAAMDKDLIEPVREAVPELAGDLQLNKTVLDEPGGLWRELDRLLGVVELWAQAKIEEQKEVADGEADPDTESAVEA